MASSYILFPVSLVAFQLDLIKKKKKAIGYSGRRSHLVQRSLPLTVAVIVRLNFRFSGFTLKLNANFHLLMRIESVNVFLYRSQKQENQ